MLSELPRLSPEQQRELQKALDTGAPVDRELALATWQELIYCRATSMRWASLAVQAAEPQLRKWGRGLAAALDPKSS